MTNTEKIAFSNSTWITLISMIASGVAANLLLINGMSSNLQTRIDTLDDKWQQRLLQAKNEIHQDLTKIEKSIPPEWFKQMVVNNQTEIRRVENEFTRDFVRATELETLFKKWDQEVHNNRADK